MSAPHATPSKRVLPTGMPLPQRMGAVMSPTVRAMDGATVSAAADLPDAYDFAVRSHLRDVSIAQTDVARAAALDAAADARAQLNHATAAIQAVTTAIADMTLTDATATAATAVTTAGGDDAILFPPPPPPSPAAPMTAATAATATMWTVTELVSPLRSPAPVPVHTTANSASPYPAAAAPLQSTPRTNAVLNSAAAAAVAVTSPVGVNESVASSVGMSPLPTAAAAVATPHWNRTPPPAVWALQTPASVRTTAFTPKKAAPASGAFIAGVSHSGTRPASHALSHSEQMRGIPVLRGSAINQKLAAANNRMRARSNNNKSLFQSPQPKVTLVPPAAATPIATASATATPTPTATPIQRTHAPAAATPATPASLLTTFANSSLTFAGAATPSPATNASFAKHSAASPAIRRPVIPLTQRMAAASSTPKAPLATPSRGRA